MAKKPAEVRLPNVQDGEVVTLVSVKVLDKSTRPPRLYTEGTLLEDMVSAGKYVEQKDLKAVSGLGTAATRDSIFETLKHHKYTAREGNFVVPTQKGTDFIHWLQSECPELVNIALTAQWEARLNVVAEKGGGREFEADVARHVTALVDKLKQAKPINPQPTNNDTQAMTEASRSNKPTQKMVDFAVRIAQRKGEELPAAARTEWDACTAYIDANKEAVMRPTEKQKAFADRIAREKGLTLPPEALTDGRLLSKWIDSNR